MPAFGCRLELALLVLPVPPTSAPGHRAGLCIPHWLRTAILSLRARLSLPRMPLRSLVAANSIPPLGPL
ncbi:hypothetical protein TRAPUB_4057 [Trametes pubescens]|uniref:Secreted protein n=1 Tax=Trametes pubescens TaxID=154538 RepID=A0A1M2W7E3_TRAPU|nr:hypothetical protein TRAPUB_4057 [Trametes pubescens]